jgi:signal transduction histidine kinase
VEVREIPKLIRDYLPYLRRKAILNLVGLQIFATIALIAILVITSTLNLNSWLLWIIATAGLIIGTGFGVILINIVTRPTKDLLAAVIHVSGEPTTTTPPNPNDSRFTKTGLSQALQTIYELAGHDSDNTTTPAVNNTTKQGTDKPDQSVINAALNATTCGFVVLNHERQITYANKSAPIKTNQDESKSLDLLFNDNDELNVWLNECEQNSVHADHIWTRVPDRLPDEEGRRFFDVIASYDKGSVHETVLTLVDRTSVYEVGEQELDFIAFAAHELRGPITVIRGYLDVLEDELDTVLQEDQKELFRRLTVSANRLSGYINNILNTSRYDRRHLKVHLAEDTLSGIYETIRDDMNLRASSQGRALNINIPADLPTIAADRASISEVLSNLIDNAIKYSNEGGSINVTAAVRGDFVEFSVQDFGIGMPGNVVANLFQKFYRSHRSRETVSGTGIGLYICKGIIESHGGTIGVRSEEGKGSTFTAAIPIYATVAAKLQSSDNNNEGLIEHGNGWIKNHSMYRG